MNPSLCGEQFRARAHCNCILLINNFIKALGCRISTCQTSVKSIPIRTPGEYYKHNTNILGAIFSVQIMIIYAVKLEKPFSA